MRPAPRVQTQSSLCARSASASGSWAAPPTLTPASGPRVRCRRRPVSLVGATIIALLFLSESYQYLFPARRDIISVDNSLNEKMVISFNISFPALSCAQVSLDAMDVSGDHQLRIEHAVFKERLSRNGRRIGERFRDGINTSPDADGGGDGSPSVLPPNYCGSCYGAKPEGEVRT